MKGQLMMSRIPPGLMAAFAGLVAARAGNRAAALTGAAGIIVAAVAAARRDAGEGEHEAETGRDRDARGRQHGPVKHRAGAHCGPPPFSAYRSSISTLWPTILLKKSLVPRSESNFT